MSEPSAGISIPFGLYQEGFVHSWCIWYLLPKWPANTGAWSTLYLHAQQPQQGGFQVLHYLPSQGLWKYVQCGQPTIRSDLNDWNKWEKPPSSCLVLLVVVTLGVPYKRNQSQNTSVHTGTQAWRGEVLWSTLSTYPPHFLPPPSLSFRISAEIFFFASRHVMLSLPKARWECDPQSYQLCMLDALCIGLY